MLGQEAVILEHLEVLSDVVWLLEDHIQQQSLQVHQLRIVRVVLPGRDLNSVFRLAAEVLLDVVNDYCL